MLAPSEEASPELPRDRVKIAAIVGGAILLAACLIAGVMLSINRSNQRTARVHEICLEAQTASRPVNGDSRGYGKNYGSSQWVLLMLRASASGDSQLEEAARASMESYAALNDQPYELPKAANDAVKVLAVCAGK